MHQQLENELRRLNSNLDTQMEVLKEDAHNHHIRAVDMRYADGSYALMPILAAKAQVLNALAMLATSKP
jgi:hypothetical protein